MPEGLFSPRQMKFLETPRIGRLATLRRDGSPHVAPIWFCFEAGEFLILTERGSQKHKNVERDPRVLLCIDDEQKLVGVISLSDLAHHDGASAARTLIQVAQREARS